jgi:hypothetical protein
MQIRLQRGLSIQLQFTILLLRPIEACAFHMPCGKGHHSVYQNAAQQKNQLMIRIAMTLLTLWPIWCFGQGLADPDSILVQGRKLPEVLLVGTFHFSYPDLDAHKTQKRQRVDILSEQKQKEVAELVEYISRFRPNKIVVEAAENTGFITNSFRNYLAGKEKMRRSEIAQIGFRLMERFGIDTVYGCDAIPLATGLYESEGSSVFQKVLDSIYKDWDFTTQANYKQLYDYEDSMMNKVPLIQYFLWRNSEKVSKRGFGAYLTEDFKLGETRGADALSMHWYNRNLRIFRNIQRITTSAEDRILVLFGAGHVDILRTLFESTPEYKLIPFTNLEN